MVARLTRRLRVGDDGRAKSAEGDRRREGTVARPKRSCAGKFTTWGNFNFNGKTVNSTATFTVHGRGDDGSTFKHHETMHFNSPPDGSVHEFFHCHDR
jgi:hypothetical protein